MESKGKLLIQRIKDRQQRYSYVGPKPPGLPFNEIVDRLVEFMLEQHRNRINIAFGNEVGVELEDSTDWRFDPIASFDKYPEELPNIQFLVEYELLNNEQELLERKEESIFAYNTLVFGVAIKLARGEELSGDLRSFVVDHLLAPNPPRPKRGPGRSPKSFDENWEKVSAIKFAVAHGLTPTRNDATIDKVSACDAVESAAKQIMKQHTIGDFGTGYGYETLRRLWWKLK